MEVDRRGDLDVPHLAGPDDRQAVLPRPGVYMVPARKGISVGRWIYEYFYQTGGYVKAILHGGC
jgi:hypothetical protein